jgi:hypothetical protein
MRMKKRSPWSSSDDVYKEYSGTLVVEVKLLL